MTEVISLKGKGKTFHQEVLDNPDKYVYIGRYIRFASFKTSKWHNPYSVKKYGRDKSIEMYKEYILNKPDLLNDLPELEGKILCCWCKPLPCHGDILVELLNKERVIKWETKK